MAGPGIAAVARWSTMPLGLSTCSVLSSTSKTSLPALIALRFNLRSWTSGDRRHTPINDRFLKIWASASGRKLQVARRG